jgi:MerR family transcriptional regulator, copper efflux regulator
MSTDTPIACSLSADELSKRVAEMTALGQEALLSVGPGARLRFRGDAETRGHLEAIIAAESRCCPFLGFDLSDESGDLALRIDAPGDAKSVASDLVNAFAARSKAA